MPPTATSTPTCRADHNGILLVTGDLASAFGVSAAPTFAQISHLCSDGNVRVNPNYVQSVLDRATASVPASGQPQNAIVVPAEWLQHKPYPYSKQCAVCGDTPSADETPYFVQAPGDQGYYFCCAQCFEDACFALDGAGDATEATSLGAGLNPGHTSVYAATPIITHDADATTCGCLTCECERHEITADQANAQLAAAGQPDKAVCALCFDLDKRDRLNEHGVCWACDGLTGDKLFNPFARREPSPRVIHRLREVAESALTAAQMGHLG